MIRTIFILIFITTIYLCALGENSSNYDILLPSDITYVVLASVNELRKEGFEIAQKKDLVSGWKIETKPLAYDPNKHGDIKEANDLFSYFGLDRKVEVLLKLSIEQENHDLVGLKIIMEYRIKDRFSDKWNIFDKSDILIMDRSQVERRIFMSIPQQLPHACRHSKSQEEIWGE